jgi:septal ring factor EnvC (AmiA/AmiB activator)
MSWQLQQGDCLEPAQFKSLLIRRRWTELLLENPAPPAPGPAPKAALQPIREAAVGPGRAEQGEEEQEPPKPELSSAQIAAAKRKHKQQHNSLSKQRKEKQRRMESLQQRLAKLNSDKHQLVTQLKQVGRPALLARPLNRCQARCPAALLLAPPRRR